MRNARQNFEILSALGQRARLRDLTYFVGRQVERNLFAWSPRGASSSRVFWLHGPPRVGKSSLAYAVSQDVAAEGGVVAWADLIDAPGDFQGALEVVLNAVAQAGVPVPQGGLPSVRLERLVSRKDRAPLLFVIDECDRLAVQMSTDEQAFLRRLVETLDHLAFFFVSRIDPHRTVEHVVEARSRLLPITNIRYLGAMPQADVTTLFQKVARDLNFPLFAEAGRAVWERVGGHPQCVTALAHELVARIEEPCVVENLREVIDDARETIDRQLQLLWPELRHRTRLGLLAKSSVGLGPQHEQDAIADGYFDKIPVRNYVRPTWLVAQGEKLGVMPRAHLARLNVSDGSAALGLCHRMNDLLFEVNRTAKLRADGQPWFEATDEWLRFYVPSRAVEDQRSFSEVLEHLYKTLYKAARTESPSDWRIPADVRSCYVNSSGVVALSELRRLFSHNIDRRGSAGDYSDDPQVAKHFFRLIGKNVLSQVTEWSTARDALLRELSEALETLLAVARGANIAAPSKIELTLPLDVPGSEAGETKLLANDAVPESVVHMLHLSDLHFGDKAQATNWHNQLAGDLKNELKCMRLDALIVSGDIANFSEPKEYGAAVEFLEQVAAEFHLSPHQIVLVPGNHDLNWKRSAEAYVPTKREPHESKLVEGTYIPHGALIELRDDTAYKKRFAHFADFYRDVRNEPYPLDYEKQYTLHHFATQKLLVLGLNSAWDLDHHFKSRAGIHAGALSRALTQIRNTPIFADSCKVAVWHHPLSGAAEDRITDLGFLEQLAQSGFQLGLHGHIHRADHSLFQYDHAVSGRRIDLVSAGTFGAPVREWVPGYPLQYNLLKLSSDKVVVETRCREQLNGAWRPDARWRQGAGLDPLPRYEICR